MYYANIKTINNCHRESADSAGVAILRLYAIKTGLRHGLAGNRVNMNILFIGDIMGRMGRITVEKYYQN